MCTTWDIFHEKLGWMLIYCMSALVELAHPAPLHRTPHPTYRCCRCHHCYRCCRCIVCAGNMCGVPLAYSFQSVFILKHTELSLSDNYVKALFVVLFIAYYIWDTVSLLLRPIHISWIMMLDSHPPSTAFVCPRPLPPCSLCRPTLRRTVSV